MIIGYYQPLVLITSTFETTAAWCSDRILRRRQVMMLVSHGRRRVVDADLFHPTQRQWHGAVLHHRLDGYYGYGYCPPRIAIRLSQHSWPFFISALPTSVSGGRTTLRLSSSSSNNNNILEDPVVLEWSQQLGAAYAQAETDGIQQLLQATDPARIPSARQLWEAVTVASQRATGPAASMLNAILAFTCDQHSSSSSSSSSSSKNNHDGNNDNCCNTMLDALELFEIATTDGSAKNNPNHRRTSSFSVQPDVVTYSLLYTSLTLQASNNSCNNRPELLQKRPPPQALAESILAQTVRASHKAAGSAGRKARVAARRRRQGNNPTFTSFREAETSIREWLSGGSGCSSNDDFAVLYEDSNVVVVNKPAGVSSYHTRSTNAGQVKTNNNSKKRNNNDNNNNSDVSMHDALVATGLPLSTLNPDAHGLVHRLDRGTSGCQCWAKNDATHARLVSDFVRRRNRKTYQCLVQVHSNDPVVVGSFLDDDGDAGTIALPVHGRPALSHYRVLQRYRNNNNNNTVAALLEVETWTGRKHQVRVHCAQGLGCPIMGDDLYGTQRKTVGKASQAKKGKQQQQQKRQQRFHLHAATLQLPLLGDDVVIEAPLPSWWGPQIEELQRQSY